MTSDLWSEDLRRANSYRRIGIGTMRVAVHAVKSFSQNVVDIQAAGLTMVTLLALVPIMWLGLGVAKSLGFSWRQDDVDATMAMVLYLEYVDSGGVNDTARQKILDYNEDDCRATKHIYDWLLSQSRPG